MLLLILITLVATAFAIVLYQLVIQKYYWGPGGPPKKHEKNRDKRQR
jgi:hypothetical protein